VSYIEILTSHGLTVEQWEDKIFSEYIGELAWKHFMGTSADMPIQVKEDLTKSDGDAITVGIRGRLVGGRVDGNAKGIGNEGTVAFFSQRITIDNYRRLVKIENIPMSQKRVKFDVLEEARGALQDEARVDLDDDITIAVSDTATGRVRGRYLYGSVDSNWNATHATALANVDSSSDLLATNMIEVAKRKAIIPVNALAKIRPMKVKVGKNTEEWFTFQGHTLSVRDLTRYDASWRNAHLNIPPQANSESPLFTGSRFKGAWDGVLVYEYDRLLIEGSAGASSIDVSHNLLLGAQAVAVCWGQRSKFGEEETDVGHDRTYEIHEIRGIQKLAYDRSTVEDNGVVHVFASAVADA
jgi:N4-gp56 family major capsid protein